MSEQKRRDRPERPHRQLGIQIPAGIDDRINELAKRENNGKSALVRRLLTFAIEAEERRSAAV